MKLRRAQRSVSSARVATGLPRRDALAKSGAERSAPHSGRSALEAERFLCRAALGSPQRGSLMKGDA
jgi:hypothetical protein